MIYVYNNKLYKNITYLKIIYRLVKLYSTFQKITSSLGGMYLEKVNKFKFLA